jgi:hypothetical protein
LMLRAERCSMKIFLRLVPMDASGLRPSGKSPELRHSDRSRPRRRAIEASTVPGQNPAVSGKVTASSEDNACACCLQTKLLSR